jgi:hypothetical protein
MNIRSFRIRNYRSIVDSGTCSLASDVTILAGKNESGKTSILHALRDFDADVAAFDQATRIQEPTGPTSVEIVFALDAATVKEVCSEALLKPTLKLKASLGDFALRKETDGTYHITEELAESIRQAREAYTADLLDSRLQGLLSEVSSVGVSVEPVGPYSSETHSQYVSIVKQVESQLPHVSADVRKELQAVLAGAKSLLSTSQTEPEEAFINAILEELPSFIYFDNFEHLLPFEIALSESPKHPAIRDFATVAGLSLETLLSTADTQKRKNLISRHAAIVDGDFRNAWHQDSVTLTADVDGQQLLMGVREQGGTELFKLTQRSKGLQWFLSFFLCLKAQRGAQSVVLVDEPGLYLHAKAQEDGGHIQHAFTVSH